MLLPQRIASITGSAGNAGAEGKADFEVTMSESSSILLSSKILNDPDERQVMGDSVKEEDGTISTRLIATTNVQQDSLLISSFSNTFPVSPYSLSCHRVNAKKQT
jgi:hypothetical protein